MELKTITIILPPVYQQAVHALFLARRQKVETLVNDIELACSASYADRGYNSSVKDARREKLVDLLEQFADAL